MQRCKNYVPPARKTILPLKKNKDPAYENIWTQATENICNKRLDNLNQWKDISISTKSISIYRIIFCFDFRLSEVTQATKIKDGFLNRNHSYFNSCRHLQDGNTTYLNKSHLDSLPHQLASRLDTIPPVLHTDMLPAAGYAA